VITQRLSAGERTVDMNRRDFFKAAGTTALGGAVSLGCAKDILAQAKPTKELSGVRQMGKTNIVYVLVDDMGYGDVSCLNPEGKIATPNLDRLAREGMVFTDAHSNSAVCSPSRYSVLTGRYSWRSTLQRGIVHPYGAPLIAEDRLTVADFLRGQGYHTGCIGKWHLGMGWDFASGDSQDVKVSEDFMPKHKYNAPLIAESAAEVDPTERQRALWREGFSKPVWGGPVRAGFDYSFGVDIPNWPPYCFIEDGRTVGIPSEWLGSHLLGNNMASLPGPAMPYWNFEQLLPMWARKADAYIGERAKKKEPFFLYLALTSPHTPLAVNKKWIGKSGLDNLYADFVMETDDIFGQVMESLKRHGVEDNTLVIFTSDNGCAHYIGVKEMEERGHFPSGQYRGYKSDAWDGGHRMPFIARWPGVIKPGSECGELVCQTDLMATCAEMLGAALPEEAGEDSFSMMGLFGESGGVIRDHVVSHSIDGKFAVREKDWKLVLCPGSGGWTLKDAEAAAEGLPLVQLYDMSKDPGEKRNLQAERPEKVKEMVALLRGLVDAGRSTPGARQKNDAEVDIWKLDTMPGVSAAVLDDY